MNPASFKRLHLRRELLENLQSLAYNLMTPIQEQSLPAIMDGRDLIAQGKTGSGKTAAFGLGILQRFDVKLFRVQALVLCPTRELADQVSKEIRRLARLIHNVKVLTLCGGMPFGPQLGSLEHGAHIVVGTPGRIEEHLRKGSLKLDHLRIYALDEADRMLDMGFEASLDAIAQHLPKQRQTLLFSATFPEHIDQLAARVTMNPEKVVVASTHDNASIRQCFYKVNDNKMRMSALRVLLRKYSYDSAVVFCNTKRETTEIAEELTSDGFTAIAINGDMEQKQRDQTLVRFANKSASILVATDVAARGLDVSELDVVVNFHMARDSEVHVHRIGRTGRAGSKGVALTLFTDRESFAIAKLEEYLDIVIEPEILPPWSLLDKDVVKPAMVTIQIDGGKKQKLRPGDILGALTAKGGVAGKQVGKIHIFDNCAYVAVERGASKPALRLLSDNKLKGRSFRVRRLR